MSSLFFGVDARDITRYGVAKDFFAAISINGSQQSRNIRIRRNDFFDSAPPGLADCDLNLHDCATRQRQYILALVVDGVWIERNRLSGGGRIKVGRPGRNIFIRRNIVDFVNDNGITVADRAPGGECPAGTDACITEHVTITDNTVVNAVSSGIFFGSDGDIFDHPDMILRDINVSRNTITGFFQTGIQGSLPASTTDVRIEDNQLVSTRPRSVVGNFTGIFLKRGDAPGVPVTNAVVKRNTVTVSGAHASSDHAIFWSGDAVGVKIVGNVVRCEDCEKLERGIHLSTGIQEDVTIEENIVKRAGLAVQIQSSLGRAEIIRNRLSHSSAAAQVDIVPAGGSVEARIADNDILDGAGYGILCRGAATFLLTGLETNFFSGNALGHIHGCP